MLYLMFGFPGAGKTTASRLIQAHTGAVHLWADHERKRRFHPPSYSHVENLKLYTALNDRADQLLSEGKSVIFDTNFNFYKDRQKLRDVAAKHGARTVVIWVKTPRDVARERATKDAHRQDTRVLGDMPVEHFERIAGNQQPPRSDETVIELDGTALTASTVGSALARL